MKHSAARSAAAPDLRPVPGLEELDVWMEGSSDLDGPLWVQFLPGEADAVIDALEALSPHPCFPTGAQVIALDDRTAVRLPVTPGVPLTRFLDARRRGGPLPPRTVASLGALLADGITLSWSRPGRAVHLDPRCVALRVTHTGRVEYHCLRPAHSPIETDVYDLGVTLFELATRRRFGQSGHTALVHDHHVERRLHAVDGAVWGRCYELFVALLRELTAFSPGARPSPVEVAERLRGMTAALGGTELWRWAVTAAAEPEPVSLHRRVAPTDAFGDGPTVPGIGLQRSIPVRAARRAAMRGVSAASVLVGPPTASAGSMASANYPPDPTLVDLVEVLHPPTAVETDPLEMGEVGGDEDDDVDMGASGVGGLSLGLSIVASAPGLLDPTHAPDAPRRVDDYVSNEDRPSFGAWVRVPLDPGPRPAAEQRRVSWEIGADLLAAEGLAPTAVPEPRIRPDVPAAVAEAVAEEPATAVAGAEQAAAVAGAVAEEPAAAVAGVLSTPETVVAPAAEAPEPTPPEPSPVVAPASGAQTVPAQGDAPGGAKAPAVPSATPKRPSAVEPPPVSAQPRGRALPYVVVALIALLVIGYAAWGPRGTTTPHAETPRGSTTAPANAPPVVAPAPPPAPAPSESTPPTGDLPVPAEPSVATTSAPPASPPAASPPAASRAAPTPAAPTLAPPTQPSPNSASPPAASRPAPPPASNATPSAPADSPWSVPSSPPPAATVSPASLDPESPWTVAPAVPTAAAPPAPGTPADANPWGAPFNPVLVTLTSEPLGVAVSIDGQPRGVTPLRVYLMPIAHQVRFSGAGGSGTLTVTPTEEGTNTWNWKAPGAQTP